MVANLRIVEDPKKSEAKPDLTHNTRPDADSILFIAGQIADVRKQKAALNALERRHRSKLKNAGVMIDVFEKIIKCREEGPDAIFKWMSDFKWLAGIFDLPIGAQLTLFDDPKEGAAVSQESLLRNAEKEGYMLALLGKSPDEQKYQPNTDLGRAHDSGWERGKKVMCEKFAALNEENAQAEKQAKVDAEAASRKAEQKKKDADERAKKKAENAKKVADLKAKKAKDKADKAAAKAAKKGSGEQPAAH